MRRWIPLICLTLAASASAATAYRVTYAGKRLGTAAHVLIDGARRRIDLDVSPDAPVALDSVITLDGGRTWTALNSQNNTWYLLDISTPLSPSSSFFAVSAAGVIRDVQWRFNEEHGEEQGTTRKYVGQLRYRVQDTVFDTKVNIRYSATVLIWTDETLEKNLWCGILPFAARQPLLDEQIAPSAKSIIGFPKKITLSVTRAYEGGPPTTEMTTLTVGDMETVEALPSRFRRPVEYREQRPVIGVPGQSSPP